MDEKQSTIAIILVIVVTILIGLIIAFTNRTKEEDTELDTSLFNVISLSEANELIDSDSHTKPVFIYIGRKDCSACKSFEPYIQYTLGMVNYYIYYVELNDIDTTSEDFAKLQDTLSKYEYEYNDETKTFDQYIGYTPMLFIVDKGTVVYGHLGGMKSEELVDVIKQYGVNYE